MDAAAARRLHPRLSLAVLLCSASLGLAGCESSSSLFGGGFGGSSIFGNNNETAATDTTQTPAVVAQTQPIAKIVLAPIIGAPDAVARQIQQDFTNAVQLQRVSVAASKDERADYTLRGYLVAAKEKSNTKVSYIWDVTDLSGKRVNRVTGEEILPGNGSKDPWAAVTPQVVQALASKAANSFVAWVSTQNGQTPIAANAQSPGGASVASAQPAADATKQPRKQQTAATAQPHTTASLPAGPLTAIVPKVAGAPGDGNQALAAAIRQELSGRGVTLAEAATANTYRIEGNVKLGEPKDGKQPILIEWLVRDPQGKKLGTVSQRNEIPAGSLDGEWGNTAQQAAGAAVQGIVKLLPPQKTASN